MIMNNNSKKPASNNPHKIQKISKKKTRKRQIYMSNLNLKTLTIAQIHLL